MTTSSVPTQKPTRVVDGIELPAAGTWRIDPGHAEVGFVGRHLVFTKVRGRFRGVSGAIHVADDPGDTTVEVQIDMSSVESGSDQRDEHLRSADLFDVERFPTATFHGAAQGWTGRAGTLASHGHRALATAQVRHRDALSADQPNPDRQARRRGGQYQDLGEHGDLMPGAAPLPCRRG